MSALAQATKRAAIYCRVSSEKQEDNASLPTQEAACRQYAAEQGYEIAGVYREIYTGAALWERPQLSALREAVRRGEADVIVAYAIDRLSRDQAHLFIVTDEWERAGAAAEFVTERFDQSPMGKFLLSAKGFAAEVEREKIRERTMRGLKARAERGKLKPGSRALYGYRWPVETCEEGGEIVTVVVRDRYEINPEEAAVVRRIFGWYVEGMPLLAITKRLSAEGVPTPTGTERWVRGTIHRMLDNPAYKGEVYRGRSRYEVVKGRRTLVRQPESEWVRLPDGAIPPLVSTETWDAAHARARRNAAEAARRNSDPEAFLLRGGYVVCGRCGRPVHASMVRDRQSGLMPAYRVISNIEQHQDCTATRITAAELDAAAETYLRRVALDPDVLARMIDRLTAEDAGAADLASVEASLATVKKQQRIAANSIIALDDEEAAAPLEAKLKELAARKKALEAERATLTARREATEGTIARLHALRAQAADLAAAWATLPYQAKRDLMAAIDLKVRLYPVGAPERYDFASDADGLLAAIASPSPARYPTGG